ncbi:MAG: class I SAM-dependent methyltransferase [Clostridiaceae bacterium]
MKPNNIDKIINSFTVQADGFESKSMNFSKKDFLEFTMRSIELNNKSVVLEVAAGNCATGRKLAQDVGSVTCVDITPAMLEIGKEEARKLNISNMNFEIGNAENLPYPDDSFDVVISRLAFHHFTDIKYLFLKCTEFSIPRDSLLSQTWKLLKKKSG